MISAFHVPARSSSFIVSYVSSKAVFSWETQTQGLSQGFQNGTPFHILILSQRETSHGLAYSGIRRKSSKTSMETTKPQPLYSRFCKMISSTGVSTYTRPSVEPVGLRSMSGRVGIYTMILVLTCYQLMEMHDERVHLDAAFPVERRDVFLALFLAEGPADQFEGCFIFGCVESGGPVPHSQ